MSQGVNRKVQINVIPVPHFKRGRLSKSLFKARNCLLEESSSVNCVNVFEWELVSESSIMILVELN